MWYLIIIIGSIAGYNGVTNIPMSSQQECLNQATLIKSQQRTVSVAYCIEGANLQNSPAGADKVAAK
jgi:hypothetical protein